MRPGTHARAAAAVLLALCLAGAPLAAHESCPDPPASSLESLFGPPTPRGITRVQGTARPFVNLVGAGGGAIADLQIEHRFAGPFRLSAGVAPLAIAVDGDSLGLISHLRLGAGWTTDYLELGVSVGTRLARLGPRGIPFAGHLRLGALDGLKLELTYAYAVARNTNTTDVGIGFSHLTTLLEVPVARGVHLFLDGAFSFDVWIYATLGLRTYLGGDGGRGTWIVSGGFGAAWVIDRFECRWGGSAPCPDDAAWAIGPTLSVGLERRF